MAIEIANNAVQWCVEPDADGMRLFAPSGGTVVSLLRGAFRESEELVRLAWRLLHADERSGLRGLLVGVDDVVLSDDRVDELVSIFERRLGEAVDETGHVLRDQYFDIEQDLGWVDRRELAPRLDGALQRLSNVDSVLGWHAIAVRWKALTTIERETASKRIARASIHEIAETLLFRYLARLVAVAPDVWCASLQDALNRGARLEASVAAEVFALLPRLQQRAVADQLATSDLAQLELPWHRRGGGRLDCARPADIVRRTLYELGL
ncbi:MAG: hypothetical protein IPL61_28395 [Myxococcales bacterium]|nr:hypothetical protein [Myxococcales bacterium]